MAQPAYRLDSRIGWRLAARSGLVTIGDRILLASTPAPPQPLPCNAAALSGVTTPLRAAICIGGTLWVLDGAGLILRFDPCAEGFVPLPCVSIPGGAIAIGAIGCDELIVIDKAMRAVTAWSLVTYRIRRLFGPFADRPAGLATIRPEPELDPVTGVETGALAFPADAWDPRGLAILPHDRIAVSDVQANRIHVFDRRGRRCAVWGEAGGQEPALVRPTALAAAEDGGLFVVEEGVSGVARLDPEGRVVSRSGSDMGRLAGVFDPSLVHPDGDGSLWLADPATGRTSVIRRDCAGQCLPAEPMPGDIGCALIGFDADGRPILASPNHKPPLRAERLRYGSSGWALIGPLDAGVAGTVWDRLRIEGEAPFGTRLFASSFTTGLALTAAEVDAMGPDQWSATELSFVDGKPCASAIRSAPGRYLWLRLDLNGDGADTPVVRAITATWPRATSMRYLPGAFAADPASADFLARFLGLFDEVRERMLDPIDRLPALFDPSAVPAAEQGAAGDDFLDWLAGWIGVALDRNWSVARRRRLVERAPALFRIRGTVEGLKRHVAVYTGIEPQVVEHFRLRRWLTLDEGRLDETSALWGAEIVRRLQLDAYSEIGRFALFDGGDPLTDPFDAFAHRATLYVPVGDGFSDADLAALEAVVDAARPAHVDVDIRLMRPRFVVGCDLVIGVNTVLGIDSRPATIDEAVLGEDIRLAGPLPGFSLQPGLRLGTDTILE
ncbi:phage tail protein [Flavisphingomonas formosensis]|uniref:phage tail protein n=1 Tax=Flavisphingomonas formosensis TaxID=861534 RepID=UPI0012FBC116|nr:phage tail protein [Sphingomonas formosensis]